MRIDPSRANEALEGRLGRFVDRAKDAGDLCFEVVQIDVAQLVEVRLGLWRFAKSAEQG